MISNAIYGEKKDQTGAGNTDMVDWNNMKKTLCVHSTPKLTLKQRLSDWIRRRA